MTEVSAGDVPAEDALDPQASAERAGLVYVTDDAPGIRRQKQGTGFTYFTPEGERIARGDPRRERIEELAVPPAWTDVWICPSPKGHLQATGRDEAGRKQYRYHPKWQDVRRRAKFDRLVAFGRALPEVRARAAHDLQMEGLPRAKVLALVVRLLDDTLIRIGGDEYARQNDSFGLTTMRRRHACFDEAGTCTFSFTGKSGREHDIPLEDPALAEVVQECCEVPGYEIFAFFDEEGDKHDVKAEHVNAYLKATTGEGFTAKQFRTWGGTVEAARRLDARGPSEGQKEADAALVEVVKAVAEKLGNTPAVCREHYIHPALLSSHRAGDFLPAYRASLEAPNGQAPGGLAPAERAVLAFLEARLHE
jgi:DNA topoisomerase-1